MVILLVTGQIGAGKSAFANILKEDYKYRVLKVEKATPTDAWDFENDQLRENYKEEILKQTEEHIKVALQEWSTNTVIYPVCFPESVETITKKRSYFKIIGIVGPTQQRYENLLQKTGLKNVTMEKFIKLDDYMNFEIGITKCLAKAEFQIHNHQGLKDFQKSISEHPLIKESIFRPSWDVYFMRIAHIVRQRSNCMKRSVGAVLVQDNRILSTGYNGTPCGLTNCFMGGCERCNENIGQGEALDKCICIHAEENTILESGVGRAKGGTIYTTLSPCRWCTKVIIQAQVKRVVYDQKYVDKETDKLFEKAGIILDHVSINL